MSSDSLTNKQRDSLTHHDLKSMSKRQLLKVMAAGVPAAALMGGGFFAGLSTPARAAGLSFYHQITTKSVSGYKLDAQGHPRPSYTSCTTGAQVLVASRAQAGVLQSAMRSNIGIINNIAAGLFGNPSYNRLNTSASIQKWMSMSYTDGIYASSKAPLTSTQLATYAILPGVPAVVYTNPVSGAVYTWTTYDGASGVLAQAPMGSIYSGFEGSTIGTSAVPSGEGVFMTDAQLAAWIEAEEAVATLQLGLGLAGLLITLGVVSVIYAPGNNGEPTADGTPGSYEAGAIGAYDANNPGVSDVTFTSSESPVPWVTQGYGLPPDPAVGFPQGQTNGIVPTAPPPTPDYSNMYPMVVPDQTFTDMGNGWGINVGGGLAGAPAWGGGNGVEHLDI